MAELCPGWGLSLPPPLPFLGPWPALRYGSGLPSNFSASRSARLLTRMLTTSLDDHGRIWTGIPPQDVPKQVEGRPWTAVDGRDRTSNPTVAGSNPAGRATSDLGILDFCRECRVGVLRWFAANVCSMFARGPELVMIMVGFMPGGTRSSE